MGGAGLPLRDGVTPVVHGVSLPGTLMTYSLNTLNASSSARSAPRTGAARFGHEIGLVVGLLALVFWLLALSSSSAQDAAWSTSGTRGDRLVANWAGRFGAWLADGSYFMLGFSVWWCVAAGVRAWIASLARWMRGGEPVVGAASPAARRALFWGGLALLMSASTALEWSRLYRLEALLPGHAGGVLGYIVGPASVKWLGFTGSGLLGIVVLVLGAALVFRFSWGHVAEVLGARIDTLVRSRLARREVAKDVAVGRKAARERAVVVLEERTESEEHHPAPVQIIEPVLADVPQSARVVKERQKPLFTEMPDSKLPLVDLLDGPLLRQETVAPETLEMTSRLIEKKLKDFGVEVRVVAAMPGPVITRYEIEPATGVKGSQIVGLAKDLARSLSLVSIRVVETIPGKNYMALELPNAKRQSIRLSEILGSHVYHEAKSMLTMGLGKDIVGNPVVADLAKMPHVLVAGTTGSGKSVGINAMILSLLYKAEARDVRLLMIDPKMLEMSVYEGIPHLLAPVVTDMPDSKLPMVDLLDGPQQKQETVSSDTLEMTSRLIEKKLKDFGVEVRVVAAMPGPVITRYEIEPATGVKGSQIVGLAKDLARSLSLVSIRVVETIPGKNYMALELPNAKRQSIRLSEILGSQIYHDAKSMLTMGLGKDIVGNPVVADLAKMPHVLVAGTTGSGKSVGINAMILSLLYKAEARDVRLLMIDPKMLEMSVYEGIPHLLAPVVTDMKQAAHGLNWCVAEMERRYKLMSKLGVRNLAGYNAKIDEAKAKEEFIYNPFSLTPEEPEPLQRLPHIVVVIDELADLMMVVGKKIEELIARTGRPVPLAM